MDALEGPHAKERTTEVRVLGPLELCVNRNEIALGGERQRLVWAALVLHANAAVSTDRLVDVVWGEAPPSSAHSTVQKYVHRLRRLLAQDSAPHRHEAVVETSPGGYRLVLEPGVLDADHFEAVVALARQCVGSGEVARAAAWFERALSLWRGPAWAELADHESFLGSAVRLESLRMAAIEDSTDVGLLLGHHRELLADLEATVSRFPLRERPRGQLMLALYRCGRETEALRAYQEFRTYLIDEVGLEPSAALQRLDRSIAAHDPDLDQAGPGSLLANGRAVISSLSADRRPPLAEFNFAGSLIDRVDELNWLEVLWRRAVEGERPVAVICGAAGMGKTRLLAELACRVHASGGGVNYLALGDLTDTLEENRLAECPDPARPSLLLLDDLDRAGCDVTPLVTQVIAPQPPGAGILVVGTVRDPAAARLLPTSDVHRWTLEGLQPGAVAALLATVNGPLSMELALDVHAQTAGNPSLVLAIGHQHHQQDVTARMERALARAEGARRAVRTVHEHLATGVLARTAPGGPAAPSTHPTAPSFCPYKGLARFEAADAPYFFGREHLTASVLAQLAVSRFVAVVGPSGSGKTSLVRAGLIPALRNGAIPGSEHWSAAVLTPGPDPVDSYTLSLRAAGVVPTDTDRLDDLTVGRRSPSDGPKTRAIAVIDQFEELFTACRDPEIRRQFVATIVDAATDPTLGIVTVLSVRADYYGACAAYPDLARLCEQSQALVGAMSSSELRRAVTGPAARTGLVVEDLLVDAVCRDAEGEPGALPLVSTALLETWKGRSGRTLTLSAYTRVGGVRGALARLADDVYESFNRPERAIARSVLLRLAEPGEGLDDVRRRASRDELASIDPRGCVVNTLVEHRLVTADHDSLEVAHEALLREWPRLKGWLDDDREGRRLLGHLRSSAREWDRRARDPAELYRGARLAATLDWVGDAHPALDDVERSYLEACRVAEETELVEARERAHREARASHRLLGLLAAAAVLLVAVLTAGVFAVRQREHATKSGTIAEARRLGTQALVVAGYDEALLLAVEGRDLDDSAETRANLLSTVERSPDAVGIIRNSRPFVDLAITTDGRSLLASTDRGAALSVYDIASRERRASRKLGGFVYRAALSPDGRLAVVSDAVGDPNVESDRHLHVVDPATLEDVGPQLAVVTPTCAARTEGCAAANLSLSPDDHLVGAVTDLDLGGSTTPPAEALVWDVAKGGDPMLHYSFEGDTRQRDLVFLPDSKSILVAGSTGTALVDLATGRELRRIEGVYAPIALSPDGRTLAGTLDPTTAVTIGLFDLATGQRRATLGGHSARIARLVFSPDGTKLASGGDDRLTMVWDTRTGQRQALFSGPTDSVQGLAFSPDGAALYSASLDGTIYHWDLLHAATLVHEVPTGHPSPRLAFPVEMMHVSPDGTQVQLNSRDDGRFEFRNVRTGALTAASKADDGYFQGFSANGRKFETVDSQGRIRIWDAATRSLLAQSAARGDDVEADAFTPDGRDLVVDDSTTGGTSSTLEVLDAVTLQPRGPRTPISAAALFSTVTPDGRQAVLFSPTDPAGSDVVVVDLRSRRVVRTIPVKDIGPPWPATALAADGHTAAIGDPTGDIAIVDTREGTAGRAFHAHDGFVESISFAPDTASFVTAGRDGAIKLWDTGTRLLLGTVQPLGANRIVQASFIDRSTVLIAYATGELFEWDTRGNAWQAHACAVAGRNLTRSEWANLFPHRPYHATCPQYPIGT